MAHQSVINGWLRLSSTSIITDKTRDCISYTQGISLYAGNCRVTPLQKRRPTAMQKGFLRPLKAKKLLIYIVHEGSCVQYVPHVETWYCCVIHCSAFLHVGTPSTALFDIDLSRYESVLSSCAFFWVFRSTATDLYDHARSHTMVIFRFAVGPDRQGKIKRARFLLKEEIDRYTPTLWCVHTHPNCVN